MSQSFAPPPGVSQCRYKNVNVFSILPRLKDIVLQYQGLEILPNYCAIR